MFPHRLSLSVSDAANAPVHRIVRTGPTIEECRSYELRIFTKPPSAHSELVAVARGLVPHNRNTSVL